MHKALLRIRNSSCIIAVYEQVLVENYAMELYMYHGYNVFV